MTASTPERQDGLQLLTEGCRVVEEKIKAAGGNFTMQMAPKVGLLSIVYRLFPDHLSPWPKQRGHKAGS